MQIVSIFITLGILVFVGLYLYAPFLERRARRVTAEEHQASALMAERERVLTALQELDFDFKLGKVPEEDYPIQRAGLLQKGADVLRKLDEVAPGSIQVDKKTSSKEKSSATRRKKTVSATSDDEIESMIAARRKTRKTNKAAGFCPKCGKPIMAEDKFCPSCGKALT